MAGRTYAIDDPLDGDVDMEARAKRTPSSFVVKGMYFKRLREKVGHGWPEVAPSLDKPPRDGKYLPFVDYPQADYTRLCAAAAMRAYPRMPLREALRRVARDDIRVFSSSTLGKVVLSVVGDATKALLVMTSVYKKMASGEWEITGTEVEKDLVRVEFRGLYGAWEYQMGQLEGVVTHYGSGCRITVTEPEPYQVRFDVRLL